MKTKLLLLSSLVAAASLSSCTMYDYPVSYGSPYYSGGYARPVVSYSSYSYGSRYGGYGAPLFVSSGYGRGGCATPMRSAPVFASVPMMSRSCQPFGGSPFGMPMMPSMPYGGFGSCNSGFGGFSHGGGGFAGMGAPGLGFSGGHHGGGHHH